MTVVRDTGPQRKPPPRIEGCPAPFAVRPPVILLFWHKALPTAWGHIVGPYMINPVGVCPWEIPKR